jgi:uncharacterized protein
MLAYSGHGYTPAFAENFDRIIARLSASEEIEVVAGPDDICAALLCEPDHHCHNDSVAVRDRDAAEAVSALLSRPIAPGEILLLTDDILADLRAAFAAGIIRKACDACEWHALCTDVAEEKPGAGRAFLLLKKRPA